VAVEVNVDLVTEQPVTGQQVPESPVVVETELPVTGQTGSFLSVIRQTPSVLPVMGQQVEPSVDVDALVRPVTGQEVAELESSLVEQFCVEQSPELHSFVELPVTGQDVAVVEQPSEVHVAEVVAGVVLESDILVY
jgi:hypothetical protein